MITVFKYIETISERKGLSLEIWWIRAMALNCCKEDWGLM